MGNKQPCGPREPPYCPSPAYMCPLQLALVEAGKPADTVPSAWDTLPVREDLSHYSPCETQLGVPSSEKPSLISALPQTIRHSTAALSQVCLLSMPHTPDSGSGPLTSGPSRAWHRAGHPPV